MAKDGIPDNTTKASKVRWIEPASEGEPGGIYYEDDIDLVESQGHNGAMGFYKGEITNTRTGEKQVVILLVPLDINDTPILSNSTKVAKPCPPACGNDGGDIVPTNRIQNKSDIPTNK